MTVHLPEGWVWCVFAGLLAGNLWFLRSVITKAVTAYEQLLVTNRNIAALQRALVALSEKVDKLAELRIDVEVLKAESLHRNRRPNGHARETDDVDFDES